MSDREQQNKRVEWLMKDRFGMFIHWGLYAIPARGEWVRSREKLTIEDYEPFFKEFNPTDYNPKEWAKLAKEAGMKYAVLTAKHHDGFCLFDSDLTDYKATNTPAGRDLVREFLEAFRAEGLKVGLYYSLLDWHHPDYPTYGDFAHPMRENESYKDKKIDFENYIDYFHGQVGELLSNYGKIDIMWFDFSYGEMTGEKWQATKLVTMMRELQPDILIDNRLGGNEGELFSGDFYSPEQMMPKKGLSDKDGHPLPWELCMTLNENWGYCSSDHDYKQSGDIIKILAECVSKGGNLLLNVGPDAKGNIPKESCKILTEVGDWMKRNGESIYGAGKSSIPKPDWGYFTQKGEFLYAHITSPILRTLIIDGMTRDDVEYARLVYDGSELSTLPPWNAAHYDDNKTEHLFVMLRTFTQPDPADTVVKIKLKPKS